MSKPRAVQLTPDLLHLIKLRPFDRRWAQWLSHEGMIGIACAPGHGWAMIDGGYVMGAAGVFPYWPGCGKVWMMVSANATWRHFGYSRRLIEPLLDDLQTNRNFYRLEATTPRDWQRGQNFLKALGFKREDMCGMREFRDGITHALFARIRPPAMKRAA